jgi:hypothetical protein
MGMEGAPQHPSTGACPQFSGHRMRMSQVPKQLAIVVWKEAGQQGTGRHDLAGPTKE